MKIIFSITIITTNFDSHIKNTISITNDIIIIIIIINFKRKLFGLKFKSKKIKFWVNPINENRF